MTDGVGILETHQLSLRGVFRVAFGQLGDLSTCEAPTRPELQPSDGKQQRSFNQVGRSHAVIHDLPALNASVGLPRGEGPCLAWERTAISIAFTDVLRAHENMDVSRADVQQMLEGSWHHLCNSGGRWWSNHDAPKKRGMTVFSQFGGTAFNNRKFLSCNWEDACVGNMMRSLVDRWFGVGDGWSGCDCHHQRPPFSLSAAAVHPNNVADSSVNVYFAFFFHAF